MSSLKRWLSGEKKIIPQVQLKTPDCFDRLSHVKSLGFSPKVIYDCGAFIGRWGTKALDLFPDSKIVLFEPNSTLNPEIEKHMKGKEDRYILKNVALGDHEGDITLNVWDNSKHKNPVTRLAASSILDHVQGDASTKMDVKLSTISKVANELNVYPDLLKLDLQGAEIAALRGATEILDHVEMCIVEFGCLDAYIERTTSYDLMDYFYKNDFVLYDIVDMRYRPYDGALVGGDYFFVRKTSQLKSHKDYF